jgi:recombination protein RecT
MATVKGGIIAARQNQAVNPSSNKSIACLFNEILSGEGYQKRFNELLGKRAPQFVSSVVSLLNADTNLLQVFHDAPITIIQAALKAAAFDLPVDPGLGYAYIVPFKNNKVDPPRYEAVFIMGYKGMNQLALRSGAYKKINVIDIREGELKSYDRLTEETEFDFIEDDDEREKRPIIGYCGYFQLVNGMEKTIYMTKKQIDQHERKHRKGQYMGKGWREDYEAMASKTVFRKLIGKWGIMSVNYQTADASTIAAATAIAQGQFDDEDIPPKQTIDMETGEVMDHTEDDKILAASLDI